MSPEKWVAVSIIDREYDSKAVGSRMQLGSAVYNAQAVEIFEPHEKWCLFFPRRPHVVTTASGDFGLRLVIAG